MPLDSDTVWGAKVAAAIKALGVGAGTPVDDAKLALVWKAVKGEDISQLGKADVDKGTFIDSLAAPISGIGGPVT